jgi:hypothetical protein
MKIPYSMSFSKQPIPLRQLVWSRYLEQERGIKGEVIKKIILRLTCNDINSYLASKIYFRILSS